jgi:hypothetical protein
MGIIKNFLKDHLLFLRVKDRFSPSVQISQRHLYHHYQELAKRHELPPLAQTGYKVFSQFEEDGKILLIFSILGMNNKTFIEIGSDDGVNSNSANLYFNFGWTGLFIDSNKTSIRRGEKFFSRHPHPWYYKPKFICGKVTRENINEIIGKAGFKGEIGFLSVDIDGNDYWIWDALDIVSPMVVMIETHNEFGMNDIVVPYDPDYCYPGKHPVYHGASPVAMTKLAGRKDYRLVGANDLGFNFIFVRNGLAEKELPEVTVESVLQHPSVKEGYSKFDEIKDWDYIKG